MRALLLPFFLLISITAFGQYDTDLLQHKEALLKSHHRTSRFKKSGAGSNYDIIFHRLDIFVNPNIDARYIKGNVTSYIKATTNGVNNISFDFRDNMNVDSILYHGNKTTFNHQNNIVKVDIPTTLNIGDIDSVTIFYEGTPLGSNSSFNRSAWAIDNFTVYTLSEPYGAFEWWPCKQQLEDKIDSIDIVITVPDTMAAASNGLLIHEYALNDSLKVFHWKHRHPIVTYLVSISVSVFEIYSDYYYYNNGNDSMEILNYVYPTSKPLAQVNTPTTAQYLYLFDSLFGPYPFINEKYGHAQFGYGGGMEHQTMSSMGGWSQDLIAHELAHQWFGNYVTCGSWSDLWLNEGFADYLTLLRHDFLFGKDAFIQQVSSMQNQVMARPNGSVFVADTLDENRLFDSRLTYSKGAMLLHMLRWIMGDENFFTACREFIEENANGFAKTPVLQAKFEEHSGKDLNEFFSDWYFGEGYPTFIVNWKQEFDSVHFQINQTQSHQSVFFFDIPIPIQLKGEGKDTTVVIEADFNGYQTALKLDFEIKEVIFDPNKWILAKSQVIRNNSSKIFDVKLYPNPARDKITVISTNLIIDQIEIVDAIGRVIYTQDVNPDNKVGFEIETDLSQLKPGVYFFYIISEDRTFIEKIIKS